MHRDSLKRVSGNNDFKHAVYPCISLHSARSECSPVYPSLLAIPSAPMFFRKWKEHGYLSVFALVVLSFSILLLPYNIQAVEGQLEEKEGSLTLPKESENNTDVQLLAFEKMHITAYTKAFAERFALEPLVPGAEPSGGLQAIELTVEKPVKWVEHYNCHFYLYVDSNLPIKLPEPGVSGNRIMLLSPTHFFAKPLKQWRKWKVEDREYSSLLSGKYNMKAFLATMDYVPNKKGAIDSITYVEYHKDLLPGLTYIKLNVSMDLLLENHRKNVGIFLQKESNTDYRGRIFIEPGNFLKFRIPDHVYSKLRGWGLETRNFNKMIRQDEVRKKRELKANQE